MSDLTLVLIVLAVTLLLFISNRLRLDLVALISLLVLALSGVISTQEALAGFSHPLVLMIAGLFVVGAALFYTGVADAMGRWMEYLGGQHPAQLIAVLMLITAFLSAFISSTGTVAVMLPVVLALARSRKVSPSRLLIPLSFASLLGGMLTLIGTPPNLVVSTQLAQAGLKPFGFFDFTIPGLIMLSLGVVFMVIVSPWLVPARKRAERVDAGPGWQDLFAEYDLEHGLAQVRIPKASLLAGQSVGGAELRGRFQVTALAITTQAKRSRVCRQAGAGSMVLAEDEVYLLGEPGRIQQVVGHFGLELLAWRPTLPAPLRLVDALIPPRSLWIGKTLRELRLHSGADVTVLAQRRRGGEAYLVDLDRKLAMSDVLLLSGKLAALKALGKDSRDVMLLGGQGMTESRRTRMAPMAIAIMLLMLVSMTFNWVPNVIAVLAAACLLTLSGCLKVGEAYRNINWESVVLIAAILPMATALENSGGLKLAADGLLQLSYHHGPLLVLAAMFLLTSFLSQMISNTATSVLLAPVAIQAAQAMSLSPHPFLMAVAIAASTAFATPVASPVNTLILNPGGYRFGDFARVGIPLQLLIMFATLIVVPWLFPF